MVRNKKDTPVIILTSIINDKLALSAIQNGAQDFLIKEQLEINSLDKAIKFAIERGRNEKKIKETEILFNSAFEQAAVGMAHLSMDREIIKINERSMRIFSPVLIRLLIREML